MTLEPHGEKAAAPRDPIRLLARLARGWRQAGDSGAPARQRLHSILAPRGLPMLAPAFESSMSLSEAALSRRLQVGGQRGFSEDEVMLGVMLNDALLPGRLRGLSGPCISPLLCSIRSIRMLLMMAAGETKESVLRPVWGATLLPSVVEEAGL